MPTDTPRSAGDADRDRLAAALGAHYAAGRLELAELDRRLERLLAADTLLAASDVLSGLPLIDPPAPPRRLFPARRHGEPKRPEPGWVPTLERFRDPASARLMRVWVDPVDGSRHYLPE